MTIADKLFLAILKYSDIKMLTKIQRDWLDSSEIPKYNYIIEYYKDNQELVGLKSFCSQFKLDPDEADSRPSLYLKNLKERFIFAEISERVPSLLKKAKSNPRQVLDLLTELVGELNSEEGTSTDSRYSDDVDERKLAYSERRKNDGVTYLSMGHPLLDKLFNGYGKTDLITFAGRAGSKKTWLLCYLAVICELTLPEGFNDILFITNEMTSEQIRDRMDVIRFELPFSPFLKGQLNRGEYQRFLKGLDTLEDTRSRLILSENVSTLDEVAEKIILYRPSITFIDGSYLLDQQIQKQEWERIQIITRSLKKIAKNKTHPCPIINTTQMKRGSGKKSSGTSFDAQDEFAFGNSYVQDSDIAIRMFSDKEMQFRQEVGLQIAKGRNVDSLIQPLFIANLNKPLFDFALSEEEYVEPNASDDLI